MPATTCTFRASSLHFTRDTGKTAWYIDEFGAVLPLVVLVFAIYAWRRRQELTLPSYA
jgi:hypothetical protein